MTSCGPDGSGGPNGGPIHASVNYGQCQEAALGEAYDFNLFALENVTQPSSDTEGRIAVGGNAYFSNYSIGTSLAEDVTRIDLMVGGDLTFPSGAVMKGRATHGGTLFTTASTSFFGGITLAPASIDFLAAGESLRTLSTGIGALVPNSYPQFNLLYGARFETVLTGYDPVVNVFNLTADQLERTHTLRISAPGGATVILNVSGSSAVFASQGLFLSGITANRVLFNFPDALSLYIGNIEIHGSVLAPRADVTFPAGQLNGHLVVKSLYGQGQMNHQIFWGCIPQVCTNPEGCDDGGEGPPLLISACTLTVDSWTHHLSAISGTLPLGLGAESGPYRVQVSSIELAYEILLEQAFSGGGNGITRLYAELLAARLNQAHGVSVSVVAGILGAADGFLAWHTAADWNGLSSTDKADVEAWVQALLNFNTGVTGPGRCHI